MADHPGITAMRIDCRVARILFLSACQALALPLPAQVQSGAALSGEAQKLADAIHAGADSETLLAAGGDGVLAILVQFLVCQEDDLVTAAAKACARMGTTARPAIPALLECLGSKRIWIARRYCARALARIGVADPTVLQALFRAMASAETPALRSECAQACALLDPGFVRRCLAARQEKTLDEKSAVAVLADCGTMVRDAMLDELAGDHRGDPVLEAAIALVGWSATSRLRKMGLDRLADRCLLEGWQKYVAMSSDFEFTWKEPCPPPDELVQLVLEAALDESGLCLLQAGDGPEGVRFTKLVKDEKDGATRVAVSETVLSRVVASVLAQQLAALGCIQVGKTTDLRRFKYASGLTHVVLQLQLRSGPGWQCAFRGSNTSRNMEDRFRGEAALGVIQEALRDAVWKERPTTEADTQFLKNHLAATEARGDSWPTAKLLELLRLAQQPQKHE